MWGASCLGSKNWVCDLLSNHLTLSCFWSCCRKKYWRWNISWSGCWCVHLLIENLDLSSRVGVRWRFMKLSFWVWSLSHCCCQLLIVDLELSSIVQFYSRSLKLSFWVVRLKVWTLWQVGVRLLQWEVWLRMEVSSMGSLSSKSFCLLLMNAMIQGIGVAVRSGAK